MTTRTTYKELESLVQTINATLNILEPDKMYELESAYGMTRLVKNKGSVNISGYYNKRELFDWLHAFLKGISAKENELSIGFYANIQRNLDMD